jgi:hypothetical protein
MGLPFCNSVIVLPIRHPPSVASGDFVGWFLYWCGEIIFKVVVNQFIIGISLKIFRSYYGGVLFELSIFYYALTCEPATKFNPWICGSLFLRVTLLKPFNGNWRKSLHH